MFTTVPPAAALRMGFFTLIALPAALSCQRAGPETGTTADAPAALQSLLRSIPDRAPVRLDAALASKLIALSLGCLDQEYPNKPARILDAPAQIVPHRGETPVFFGCFDWHSAVHGHWSLVRVLRLFPAIPEAGEIRKKLDDHLRSDLVARELAFFREDRNKIFERPYGWGWLFRLDAELAAWEDPDALRYREALKPLVDFLAGQLIDYLNRLTVPVRDGTHQNTAFALIHALDFARARHDKVLEAAIEKRAREFYQDDRMCPTDYEPSGEDFLSSCLTEADLMRRVLPGPEFVHWLDRFLPPLTSPRFLGQLKPVEVHDLKDPRLGHLIGLSWERAACFDGIAGALPKGDLRAQVFGKLAGFHRTEALRQMFDTGYYGEHWLVSFALYALEPSVLPSGR